MKFEPTEQDLVRAIDLLRARIEAAERGTGSRIRIETVKHEIRGSTLRVIAVTPSNFSFSAEIDLGGAPKYRE